MWVHILSGPSVELVVRKLESKRKMSDSKPGEQKR